MNQKVRFTSFERALGWVRCFANSPVAARALGGFDREHTRLACWRMSLAIANFRFCLLLLEVVSNCGELLKRSFQILHNFGCNHIRIGEISAVFE